MLPENQRFKQDHTKSTVRLIVGYTGVAIAGFTLYAENKLKWDATTSPWIVRVVVAYFVLNAFLTFWVWIVEAGEIFKGATKRGYSVGHVRLLLLFSFFV